MQNEISENEFIDAVLLTAFILSFGENEKVLSLDEVIARKFAPSTSLTRAFICRLIKVDSISAFLLPRFCFDYGKKSRKRIILMNSPDRKENLLLELIFKIKLYVKSIESDCVSINRFYMDVFAGECIEYTNFYAERNNLHLLHASHHNFHLKFLLINNSREQVFMLLWRAIKFFTKNRSLAIDGILFSDIAEKAYDFYNWYKNQDMKIDSYSWPVSLKRSKISNLLINDILLEKKT